MMDSKKALDRMMASCSRREHCVSEIRAKLEKLEVSAVDEIIAALLREKYIDEARYASAFARDKSSLQGWGPSRIRRALALKGISADDIENGLSGIDSSAAAAKMNSVLGAKARQLLRGASSSDFQAFRIKILRYGISRGYSYDAINDFLTNFAKCDVAGTQSPERY